MSPNLDDLHEQRRRLVEELDDIEEELAAQSDEEDIDDEDEDEDEDEDDNDEDEELDDY